MECWSSRHLCSLELWKKYFIYRLYCISLISYYSLFSFLPNFVSTPSWTGVFRHVGPCEAGIKGGKSEVVAREKC